MGWKRGRFLIALCHSLAPFPHNSEKGKDQHSFYQFSPKQWKENGVLMLWLPIKWLYMHNSGEIS